MLFRSMLATRTCASGTIGVGAAGEDVLREVGGDGDEPAGGDGGAAANRGVEVRAGLDPAALIAAIGGGAATSWMWTNLGPRMQADDLAPGFMVKLQQKDLRLALAAGSEVGVALPLTALVQQLLTSVEAHGGGALGTQAIVTAFERLAVPSR